MPCFANALKLAEEIRGRKRGLLWAVFLALAVTLLSSVWSVMTLSYKYGGINLHEFWFVGVPRNAFNFIAPKFVDPVPASISGWGFTGLGRSAYGLVDLYPLPLCVVADPSVGFCHWDVQHYELGVVQLSSPLGC